MVFIFIIKCIGIEEDEFWKCNLCKINCINACKLLEHIWSKHLNFLFHLLLGGKDKCFYSKCSRRFVKSNKSHADLDEHLKFAHSGIYLQDDIFCKLY